MYSRKNTQNEKDTNKRVYFNMAENRAVVTNVRKINDRCIGFTLKCSGFSFYNLRAVQYNKSGDWFISVPATKGKDGKYYDNYGLYLREEDQNSILDTVFKTIVG